MSDQENVSGIEIGAMGAAEEGQVSDILEIINLFKSQYADEGLFPDLNNPFELNLFNTFRCYMDIPSYYPVKLIKNSDERAAIALGGLNKVQQFDRVSWASKIINLSYEIQKKS